MARALSLAVLLTVSIFSFRPAAAADPTTIWVSTSGNDVSGNGSLQAPFFSIDRARRAVQKNKNRGVKTLTVNIKPGTYNLKAPLTFDAGDSGSASAPVIYQAAPGARSPVVISGGTAVTGFTCATANSLNMCSAAVQGLPAGEMPRQFYVRDQRATRARSNVGLPANPFYNRVANGYQQTIAQSFAHPELMEAVNVTQWKMMRCPVARQAGTTLVLRNPCWNNTNSYPVPWNFQLLSWLENAPEFLTAPDMWFLDPAAQKITFVNPAAGQPQYAVLPVLETLVDIKGSRGAPVSNITFKDLQFSYATWLEPNTHNGYASDQSGNILKGAGYQPNTTGHQRVTYKTHGNVELRYAHNITFDQDGFTHLGGTAIDLDTGSQNNRITNSIFTDISSAAIQIGGFTPQDMRPSAADTTSGNLVSNNDISYTGRDFYDSAGIFVGFTTGTTIIHNTISHTPWTAVAIGWGWGLFDERSFPGLVTAVPGEWGRYTTPTIASNNLIESNKFVSFLEQMWDGGAIYTNGSQGTSFANGLTIKLNVAENKRPAAGSNIYYTDGGSQYVTLIQNVSLNDPVGTADFGPCGYGSSIAGYCLLTGVVPYGADFGGCLPVGNLMYRGNYFLDPINFYGPQICHNDYVPDYPVNLRILNNIPTRSTANVPNWILLQAGTHQIPGPHWAPARTAG